MKVAFLSLYFNHHQASFAKEMSDRCEFSFIELSQMSKERLALGYKEEEKPPYVAHLIREPQVALKLIDDADVIIYGAAPYKLIREQIKKGKLVFKYSERIYKEKPKWYEIPVRAIKYNNRYRKIRLLCASAYTASDYALSGTFKGKAYKWGYFPELKEYESIDDVINNKQENSILWCGRIIDWKHPEMAVKLAKRLKDEGYSFHIDIVGDGTRVPELLKLCFELDVEDRVSLLGAMSPDSVREKMEQSEIFIATSDRKEGWGVVVNEAMNSGCVVVASKEMGAVPYLIREHENGLTYSASTNIDKLYSQVKFLLDNREKRIEYSKSAYRTILERWNSKMASKNLLSLIDGLLQSKDISLSLGDGICSPADNNTGRK